MPGPRAFDQLFSRKAEARHALRVTAAALAAFVLARSLSLPQGYWAVFTAVIVVQTSIGGTLSASIDRMIGTVTGAAVGGVLLWLHQSWDLNLNVAVGIAVASTAFLATLRPDLKVAPITAVIMLISPSVTPEGPALAAVLRVAEIALGSVIGVAATLLIFPARAHAIAAAKAESALLLLAELAERLAERIGGGPDDPRLYPLHAGIRAALGQVEAALTDAARERSSRLSDHPLPDGLSRVLWRIRNDVTLVARTSADPMPEAVWARLEPAAQAMLRASAEEMRAVGALVRAGVGPVDRSRLELEHQTFQDTVEGLRRDGLTRVLNFDAAGQVFGLAYALEALYRNLSDLANRAAAPVPEGGPANVGGL